MRPPIPNPEAPEFWLQYAEPHEELVPGAARLRDTVADVTDGHSAHLGDRARVASLAANRRGGPNPTKRGRRVPPG
jgi:hypothetical protein